MDRLHGFAELIRFFLTLNEKKYFLVLMKNQTIAIYLFFIMIMSFLPLPAQEIGAPAGTPAVTTPAGNDDEIGRKAEYYMTTDEMSIRVNVWGQVSRPGRYTIPIKTDLVSFLSLAGGPLREAKLDEVKIVRHVEGKYEVIKVNIKRYLNSGDPALIPYLMPDDTVVVSGTIFHLFTTTVQYLSQLMTVITFYHVVTK
jgi:hypothetical protein